MKTFYHITANSNLDSINAIGLDPKRATQKRVAVWMVTKSKIEWALIHTMSKARAAGLTLEDFTVLEITMKSSWCNKRSKQYVCKQHGGNNTRGIWYCFRPITPNMLKVFTVDTGEPSEEA